MMSNFRLPPAGLIYRPNKFRFMYKFRPDIEDFDCIKAKIDMADHSLQ
jgi:hypothetical protein